MKASEIITTFQTVIASKKEEVVNSFPSIFTREDVLSILYQISETTLIEQVVEEEVFANIQDIKTIIKNSGLIGEITSAIVNDIDCNIMDYVNGYDLSMSGNEVEVDSLSINERSLGNMIQDAIKDAINEYDFK